MNNYLKYIAFGIILIVAGCAKKSPSSVAERFFSSMGKNDFDGAKKYGTENTGKILDMLKGFQEMFTPSAKREHKYEIVSERMTGDSAIIIYKIDNGKADQTLNLVKEAGVWKVAMNIGNMDDGADEPMDTDEPASDEDSLHQQIAN